MTKNKNNQAIWHSRIKKKASTLFQKVGSSISVDKRLYEEDIKGSIEIGKYADFTVLSQNIITVPEDQILNTKDRYTIINGQIEYKAN